MRLTMLLAAFNLCACAGIPKPDTFLGVVNAPALHIKGYNLSRDYDNDGDLKPGARAEYRSAQSVGDLNKYTCTDPDGLANLKAYIKKLRESSQQCQKGQTYGLPFQTLQNNPSPATGTSAESLNPAAADF